MAPTRASITELSPIREDSQPASATTSYHYKYFCRAITSTTPAGDYVGVTQTIAYGSESIMSSAAGIVDTGTTLVYIPSCQLNIMRYGIRR